MASKTEEGPCSDTPKKIQPEKWHIVHPDSERWANPKEWNFQILKRGNFNPVKVVPMLGKYFSAPSECTKLLQNPEQLLEELQPGEMRILWIGHATLLVQMEGWNILTDPVFSDIAGPNRLMGYKRYRGPAITIKELEKNGIVIHAVIISHNHYDHFDEQSIKELNECYHNLKWFVPMGLKEKFESWGCADKVKNNVKEFTWWESHKDKEYGLEFHFTPAKHWSGRGTLDWYKTLWGSWIIKGQRLTFFFAGDTGFEEELFETIKKKFEVIDVAALPIGAYEPREMMVCQHINPEEAVKIHNLLGVKMSVGIHWATFQLTTESMDDTKEDLKQAMISHNVKEGEFQTLEESLITKYKKSYQGEEKSDQEEDKSHQGEAYKTD